MDKEVFSGLYRHSLAHILAKAVIEMFGPGEVQYAIGPQIADGCYYDFALPRTLGKEDFAAIENGMRDILKRKEDWTRREVTKAEALDIFKDQKYKVELINELPDDEIITVYYTGEDFVDLCRGPHVENSRDLLGAAFCVRSVSGSYWKGDENNDQLQRIYLYAFEDKKALKEHLDLVREAMERDHKKLGPQLDLFMFDPTAPGMPYWLPKGWKLYNALMNYWRQVHELHGYTEISAPVINNKEIWETSGHWGHYKKNMFCIQEDGEDYWAVKPMNCPNAVKVYQREQRSYKDLPIRLNTVDVIHRKEKSGELNGLFRVQEFRQDDSHNLIREDQIEEEIRDIMTIADEMYGVMGLTYRAELSTRPDDFMGEIEAWDKAEASLKRILDSVYGEGNYEINEGDGAFYGPKIDLQMKDCLGREWQMGTIQLDFQLPLNFDLKYVAADGNFRRPVMVHRAIFGSFERFIGILIENFKGAFPFWLSPVQVGIVPIRTEHNEYAKEVAALLRKKGIRFEMDLTDRNMKEKIKVHKNAKVPYVAVLGEREMNERTVSLNIRGNRQLQGIPLDEFIDMCVKMNEERPIELL